MTFTRSLSALLAAAAASTLLAGSAFAADPIKIGVPVGLSGANSVVAPSVVQSAELAVAEINAKGGRDQCQGRRARPPVGAGSRR